MRKEATEFYTQNALGNINFTFNLNVSPPCIPFTFTVVVSLTIEESFHVK